MFDRVRRWLDERKSRRLGKYADVPAEAKRRHRERLRAQLTRDRAGRLR
jgi:hypothetical protein